jgi:prefoldin subunit 5
LQFRRPTSSEWQAANARCRRRPAPRARSNAVGRYTTLLELLGGWYFEAVLLEHYVSLRLFFAMSLAERLSEPTVDEAKRNGIPAALFIDDVAEFLIRERQSAEEAIYFLQDLHRKYKFLERRLLANKGQLKGKIPDILQSLDAVRLLKSSQDSEEGLVSNFQLCESLYATARIKKQQHIGLWLGANVMMEYTLDEAEDLLTSNLATAQASLIEVDTGLSFCREQLTTTEVNIARVYNHDVQQRRQV